MVMEVVHEEMTEGNIQCAIHPYKHSTPGGICAFCLQEKLGKLISSPSFAIFPSSSSTSSSPSFRSAAVPGQSRLHVSSVVNSHDWSRLPFVLLRKKKKKEAKMSSSIVYRRSKSTASPGRALRLLDENYSNRRRGFWSFLYTPNNFSVKKTDKTSKDLSFTVRSKEKKSEVVEENEVNRKVCRSRSIGCGSGSFSGDFFERISTGFGDCTLRRAQSLCRNRSNVEDCIKERGRCGIFSGFMMTSSSLSSYLVSGDNVMTTPGVKYRNWKMALRAFTGKRDSNSNKNNALSSPNLA